MQRPDKYASLKRHIRAVHAEGKGSPGKRMIQSRLRNQDIKAGVYLVGKLMKEMALVSRQPVKKPNHTGGTPHLLFENHLRRQFDRKEGDPTVLCGDVTYIQVNGQWYYLAAVLDLNRRRLAGWAFGDTQDAQLVCAALRHAMLKMPSEKREGAVFHSDQGSVYGSKLFTECVRGCGLMQSMSRRGNCWDNAPMERWFRSFKSEWMPKGGYATFEEALDDIRKYVLYYNHIRPHTANNGLPPLWAEAA